MGVKYKTWFSVAFLALGLLLVGLNAWLFLAADRLTINALTGFILILIGGLALTRPLFLLSGDELVVFNLFGRRVRAYPLDALDVERDPATGAKILFAQRSPRRRRRLFASNSPVFDNHACRSVIAGVEGGQAF